MLNAFRYVAIEYNSLLLLLVMMIHPYLPRATAPLVLVVTVLQFCEKVKAYIVVGSLCAQE